MKVNSQKCLNVLIYIALSFMIGVLYDRMYMVNRWGMDDFEHLLSAMFIHNGYRPYADYFQHHHPLLWYLFSPLFGVIKNPLNSYFIARTIMGIIWAVGCLFIGLIIKKLGGTAQSFLYALLVYVTFMPCAPLYIQTRPDTPMIVCLLMGTYFWILFYQNRHIRDLILSYLMMWLSFAFLQKAGMFLLPFGIYQFVLLCQKKLSLKQVLIALILPLSLTGGYLFYLYQTDTLLRYWELNWILNAHWYRDYQTYSYEFLTYVYCAIGGLTILYTSIKSQGIIRQLSWVCLGALVIFMFVPKPYEFYWAFMSPLLAIACGLGFDYLMKRGFWTHLIAIACILWILFEVFLYLWFPRMIEDVTSWERRNGVYQQIGSKDVMITYGDVFYGMFKSYPEHYYYFTLERGSIWDRDLFHRHELPDWDKVIYETMPKFVLAVNLHYCKTECIRKLMGVDKEFLQKNYELYYPSLVWKRKE